MNLEVASMWVGRDVIYYPPHHGIPERGVISSVNDTWVFVQYAGAGTPKPTDPARLEFTN